MTGQTAGPKARPEPHSREEEPAVERGESAHQTGAQILAIDDDPDILDAIRFLLEDAGYDVTTAEKGEYAEALTTTGEALPDLIILDVLLSGKDGRLICKQLKAQEQTRHIPVLMISAHPGAERSVKEVGADAFVAKPFEIATLLRAISRLLDA